MADISNLRRRPALALLVACCLTTTQATLAAGGNPPPPTNKVLAFEAELKVLDPTTESFGRGDSQPEWSSAHSFVVSGDTAAAVILHTTRFVGADRRVEIFRKVSGTWVTEAVVLPPDPIADRAFGTALALDGDTLAVSVLNTVPSEAPNPLAVNGVYVFHRVGSNWLLQARLVGDDALGTTYGFGSNLSLNGGVLAIGAGGGQRTINSFPQETRSGAVYVFENTGGTWLQTARLSGGPVGVIDGFGASGLSVSGDTVAVGQTSGLEAANGQRTLTDSVFLYQRTAGAWPLQARVQPSDQTTLAELLNPLGTQRHSFRLFGFSAPLALNGNTLIVGGFDTVGRGALNMEGKAYVFNRNLGAWSQSAVITPKNRSVNDGFGNVISFNGTVAGFGYSAIGTTAYAKGSVFKQASGVWAESELPTASNVTYDALVLDGTGLYSRRPGGQLVNRLSLP